MRRSYAIWIAVLYNGVRTINYRLGGLHALAFCTLSRRDGPLGPTVKPWKLPANGLTVDQYGVPSIFSNTSAVNDFVASNPGTVGTRGILRGFNSLNTDLAIAKYFPIKEHYRIQLRAEAFNAFNRVNFANPSLSTASPTTFGEISLSSANSVAAARVMQFAARFEF